MKNLIRKITAIAVMLMLLLSCFTGCGLLDSILGELPGVENPGGEGGGESDSPISLDSIPAFDGSADYILINGNKPFFDGSEDVAKSWESFSELDHLGRCGVAFACIGKDIMPTGERGEIGQVKPTGWQTVKYDFISGKYLYNRCHLIGYQLTGENANRQNLITGTRFLNIEGMLPFEDMIADYVKETENHVIFRVTPIFEGEDLVASGVLMEGWSVEDNGDGICFCVYAYNNQPGVIIDYATGDSHPEE
jgi:DNA-entry nuclease